MIGNKRKGNEKTRLAWFYWDINTGYRSKKLTGRSDWIINTARHYTQRRHMRQKTTAASTLRPTCIKPKKQSTADKEQRGRHHRTEEGHRYAGPNTAMLLHLH
jgi:hypothetical protein